MKEIKLKFTEKLEENRLTQEINNNPESITPALSDEEIRESVLDEWENKIDIIEEEPIESFPTTEEIKEVFTGEWDRKFNLPELTEEDNNPINNIEDMTDPNPVPPVNPDENPTGTSQELKPINTVRIMDGNFPF